MSLEPVELYKTNSRIIPDMLRLAAEECEKEDDDSDKTQSVVLIRYTEGGQTLVYGWGKVDNPLEALGILHKGIQAVG